MEKWVVKFYSGSSKEEPPVKVWLDERNAHQLKSIAKELKLLELCGNTLRLPHSKSLGDGLFELRERNYGYRIYYAFFQKRNIVLLGAGDKDSQKKDIKLARDRLAKLENEG